MSLNESKEKDYSNHSIFSGQIQVINEKYYEELFLMELKYKRECNPELVTIILEKYQTAIEYFNAIDSDKGKAFESRMKLFITRPEVVAHLKLNKKSAKEKNKDISEENKIKKEVVQSKISAANDEMRKKIDYLSVLREKGIEETKQIVKEIMDKPKDKEEETKKKIEEQLSKQDLNFQERLKKKRMKAMKIKRSKSFSKESTTSNKLMSLVDKIDKEEKEEKDNKQIKEETPNDSSKEEKQLNDKSTEDNININLSHVKEEPKENKMEIIKEEDESEIDFTDTSAVKPIKSEELPSFSKNSEIECTPDNKKENPSGYDSSFAKDLGISEFLNKSTQDNNQSQSKIIPEVQSFNPESPQNSSDIDNNNESENNSEQSSSSEDFDETFFDQTNNTSNENNSNLINEVNALYNIGPKQKRGLIQIKKLLSKHVKNFNKTFNESVFPILANKVKKIMNEKFKSYVNISEKYQEQITKAEMEENAEEVIEEYNKELENELAIDEDKFDGKIQKEENDFKTNGFRETNEIILLEEKFRSDMCNQIIDLISSNNQIDI
ncbi:MAG: hypothetical protein MJ252_04080 [archaeon]|nr:hypothetical protein [archaeon]